MSVEILNCVSKLFLYESFLKLMNFSPDLNTIVQELLKDVLFKRFLNLFNFMDSTPSQFLVPVTLYCAFP